jgi:hypothetical protein
VSAGQVCPQDAWSWLAPLPLTWRTMMGAETWEIGPACLADDFKLSHQDLGVAPVDHYGAKPGTNGLRPASRAEARGESRRHSRLPA